MARQNLAKELRSIEEECRRANDPDAKFEIILGAIRRIADSMDADVDLLSRSVMG